MIITSNNSKNDYFKNELDLSYEISVFNENAVSMMTSLESNTSFNINNIESFRTYISDILFFMDKRENTLKWVFRQNYMQLQTLKRRFKSELENKVASGKFELEMACINSESRIYNLPNCKFIDGFVPKVVLSYIPVKSLIDLANCEGDYNLIRGSVIGSKPVESDNFYNQLEKMEFNKKKYNITNVADIEELLNQYQLFEGDLNKICETIKKMKTYFQYQKSMNIDEMKKYYKSTDSSIVFKSAVVNLDYFFRVFNMMISVLADVYNYKNTLVFKALNADNISVTALVEQYEILNNYRELSYFNKTLFESVLFDSNSDINFGLTNLCEYCNSKVLNVVKSVEKTNFDKLDKFENYVNIKDDINKISSGCYVDSETSVGPINQIIYTNIFNKANAAFNKMDHNISEYDKQKLKAMLLDIFYDRNVTSTCNNKDIHIEGNDMYHVIEYTKQVTNGMKTIKNNKVDGVSLYNFRHRLRDCLEDLY